MYSGKPLIQVHIEKYDRFPNIQFHHGFKNNIYVQCINENGTVVQPLYVKRINTTDMIVKFNKILNPMYVCVFNITEYVSCKKYTLSSNNEYSIRHDFNFNDFMIQCWNTSNEIVYPKTAQKIDNTLLNLSFFETNFSGYVNMIGLFPNYVNAVVKEDSLEWEYNHYQKESVKCSAVEFRYSDGSMFMPKEIIIQDLTEKNNYDNVIRGVLNIENHGKIVALITGNAV